MGKPLILLDRDGVLNRVVVEPEQGTVDSPLHPDQVTLLPGVAEALAKLTAAGYGLAVVTNQPAWAKKKTTRANLEAVHETVVAAATRQGGRILSSHLCLHRAEDDCDCRKPKPGMLLQGIKQYNIDPAKSYFIGDRERDVIAGTAAGVKGILINSDQPISDVLDLID